MTGYRIAACALVLTASLGMAGCGSGHDAVPSGPASAEPDPSGLSTARTAEDSDGGYWTPERMESAIPAPMPMEDREPPGVDRTPLSRR